MTQQLFQTTTYKALMDEHIAKTLIYLFEENQEFAIACDTKYITFDPELSPEITESFGETVLFVLGGYTFESAKIDRGYLVFEAGFGSENIGAVVRMPLLTIKQIFVDDHPIVINLADPLLPKKVKKEKIQNSMEALLNNPENKKLLKKRP